MNEAFQKEHLTWPDGIFGMIVKTMLPPKKEGEKIVPSFPQKTLAIKVEMKPDAPMELAVERVNQGGGSGSGSMKNEGTR